MPEYLAPGVFVEETSFRSKSIEGVSTSTTAFVGPTRRGPTGPTETPELLTSFADFERIYGGLNELATDPKINYVAHAARVYFNEGGARLYVARVSGGATAQSDDLVSGKASKFKARFGGEAGNGTVVVTMIKTPVTKDSVKRAIEGTLVRIPDAADHTKDRFAVLTADGWKDGADLEKTQDLTTANALEVITINVLATDKDGNAESFDALGLHPTHKRFIGTILYKDGNGRNDHVTRMFSLDLGDPVSVTAKALFDALKPTNLDTDDKKPKSKTCVLKGGTDVIPATWDEAFNVIAGLDDVSIIAAPGHTEMKTAADHVRLTLISSAEARRSYRVAVLDVPKNKTPTEARGDKASIDSKYAAVYYPWVVVPNPLFDPLNPAEDAELLLPPSGFVCGIYARSDIERGVWKAPANEVVRSALRFERLVTNGEQEMLNPLGVNCLRYFAGRGHRVWGARTASSDPEWKYVNIRRYFLYLEHSIDRGTQWAVFEPNGERLWANIKDTVESFLYNEWEIGALLGSSPKEAYFVQCDRRVMTQNDLDNGRLVCLVGVAAIKPAEFVIFRIGQKTADARS
jgi:phage tail sheath protein FI